VTQSLHSPNVITTDKLGGGRCWLGAGEGVPAAAEAKLEIHQPSSVETVARCGNVIVSSNSAPHSSCQHIDPLSVSPEISVLQVFVGFVL
jgi:hypothetical protein